MVKYFNTAVEDKEKEFIDSCIRECKAKGLCSTKQDWLVLASTTIMQGFDNEDE